jgi:stress response protein SCP2
MTVELSKGANTGLAAAGLSGPVVVSLTWAPKAGIDADLSALLLTAERKARDDADFVFYNQPRGGDGAVRHLGKSAGGLGSVDRVRVDPAALPTGIERVAVGASLDGEGGFGVLGPVRVEIAAETSPGEPAVRYEMDDATVETAIVAIELYLRGGEWKARAVGQGYSSGLGGMASDFGIDIEQEGAGAPAASPVGQAEPAAAQPALDLTKPPIGEVSLQKSQKISFAKTGGKVTASLKWTKKNKDLDLYALYVGTDGTAGTCYYKDQGALEKKPYICLVSGDQKSGGSVETIEISRPDEVSYVLICAYSAVSNGIGSFRSFGAYAEVTNHAGSTVASPLYHRNAFSYWVALALIDLTDPGAVSIQHVETYSKSGSEARPLLHSDGTFEMDKGPVEFKRE